jgi:hypothetical protein
MQESDLGYKSTKISDQVSEHYNNRYKKRTKIKKYIKDNAINWFNYPLTGKAPI